jgi:mRNA interferase MazF
MPVKRGEVYWLDWSPGRGSEQAGRRPALVIQNDIGNKYSVTTIVASFTTAQVKLYPVIVPVTATESGLPKDSYIDLGAIMTIWTDRLERKCGELSAEKMAEVNVAIKKSLALD